MVKSVQKVAVLGAGVMGSTIAGLLAGAGAQVLMLDILPPQLTDEDKAKGLTEKSPAWRNKFALAGIDRLQDKKSGMLYSKTQLPAIETGNLTDDIARLAECDWILEVVLEKLEVKQQVMGQIAKYRRKGSIVSSNTSGISINAIAQGQDEEFRQHFLGTHFFNPPRFMHLFELIPCKETLPEVMDVMSTFGEEKLGKGVVIAKDTPNFIGNRIGIYASLEVMRLMDKYGFDIPTLDQLTGGAMGHPKSATFRTLDMVGLDVFCHVADNVVASTTDKDEIARFTVPEWVNELVAKGALGDKTKHGMYKKTVVDGKRTMQVYDVKAKDYVAFETPRFDEIRAIMKSDNKYAAFVYGDTEFSKFAWDFTKRLLLYSATMVPEISDDYTMIDKAINWGFNWEKGPFEVWDAIGLEKSIARMKEEGETIPAWVEERAKAGKPFYEAGYKKTPYTVITDDTPPVVRENEEAKLRDMGDGVLLFEFVAKGNSIGQGTMEVFAWALEELDKPEWKGMVIGNQGPLFSAGANIVTISFGIVDKQWDEIEQGIKTYQDTNMALKYARKPIVAAPHSRVLGGGCECVMHSAAVTPNVETYIGLVEVGVGLLPGAGGNKELLIRCNEHAGSDKPLDLLPSLIKTFQAIATAQVATNAFDAIDKGYMRKSDTTVVMNPDANLDAGKKKVLEMAANSYMPPAKARIKVLGDMGRAALDVGLNDMKVGGFVSEYDMHIAKKVAWVLTGGNAVAGTVVDEQYLLDLEREAFLSLCGEEKTFDRIEHMLTEGKPLRN